eukprot:scaffold42392_cov36-Phaeocystis_antarctica.AAC.1
MQMWRLPSQLGSVGYLIGAAGITFPGEIAKGVSFASVNSDGTPRAAASARRLVADRAGLGWQ